MYYTDEEAKRLICEYGRRVYACGMVAGNEGNISIRTGENAVWVTPTGVSKGELTEEMLSKTDLDGNVLEAGSILASSESRLHYGIYRQSEKVGAVFHTHATFATAFACSAKRVNTRMMPELLGLFGEEIPVAPYARPGTFELPEAVAPLVKTNRAALIENHGAVTWAETAQQAYYNMEFLEKCCKVYAISNFLIGGAHEIPNPQSIAELLADFQKNRIGD